MLLIIVAFLLFIGLVVVHEYGHFMAARRNGVEVEEFGIGFPPRAKVLAEKNGTKYTLNWLPLGGFVKLKGENDADQRPGTFGAASLWAKIQIMLAGVVMNAITAFILFTVLALIGMPKIIENQATVASDTKVVRQEVFVGAVSKGSPAEQAGIKAKDVIVAITAQGEAERAIEGSSALIQQTQALAGQEVQVKVRRSGAEQVISGVQLNSKEIVEQSKNTDEPKGYLGVVPSEFVVRKSTWSAPVVALKFMAQISVETMKGLGKAIGALFQGDTKTASNQVSGIVGIGVLLTEGSSLGAAFILMIIGIISLTLAIMNILPIPALDGGRLFVTLLFRAIKKPLTPKIEERIHGTGFALLMLLFVLITVVDIKRFF